MIVDCQAHLFPPAYGRIFTRNQGGVKLEETNEAFVSFFGDAQRFVLPKERYAPELLTRSMDEAGIDVSVVSANIPGPELLDEELRVEGAKACNEGIAEACAEFPGRIAGLASLPYTGGDDDVRELERAVSHLGLRGFVLPSHIRGLPVDDPQFAPIFAKACELEIPAVIHPTVPTWSEVIRDYSLIPMVGLMMDHSIAALRLILGGVMERFPELAIVHPHCGGVLPYLMPRITEQTEVKRRGREHIAKPPAEYYRSFYLDLVSPSQVSMKWALEFHPADRLLFATDQPWVSATEMLALFSGLDLPSNTAKAILGENAAELFALG